MGWNHWYATKSYLSSALWIAPLVALLSESVAIRLVLGLQDRFRWMPTFGITLAGSTEAVQTVQTLTISFIVFTFGSLLVAIQVASGQLTPRIIATALLRNNVIRFTVGLFTFTMMFAVGTSARIDTTVYYPAIAITWILGIVSLVAFLFLIDYTARLLRPVSILWRISEQGVDVIESIYPKLVDAPSTLREDQALEPLTRTIDHRGKSAIVSAVNLRTLVSRAQDVGGVIELVPRVGDFVATGEPLFRLYGAAARLKDRTLRTQVAFDRERTIEQDVTFALRVIVDIAIKALSPAINDPTTAVLAIDQLHRLLRVLGKRHLHNDALYDTQRVLRVILRSPTWQDIVQLAVSEIRLYGANNFQVSRRLYAMITDLLDGLPDHRHPELSHQLRLLDQTLGTLHQFSGDLEFAREPDFQGIGGSSRH